METKLSINDFLNQTNGQVTFRIAIDTGLFWVGQAIDMRGGVIAETRDASTPGQLTIDDAMRVLLDKLDIWKVLVDQNTKK